MKTLLFIPGYYYNSIENFMDIISYIDESMFNKVFLDMDDPTFRAPNSKYSKDEIINSTFDNVFFLDHYSRCKNKIHKIIKFIVYKYKLRKIINTHKPDVIIFTNDRNASYANLKKIVHSTPIILLQTSLLNVDYYIE